MLDARHRDAGADDGPDTALEIDFDLADFVAPVAPADGRDDDNGNDPKDEGKDDGEDAQVEWNFVGVHDQGDGDGGAEKEDDGALNGFADPPHAECSGIEVFTGWSGRFRRHSCRVASF